MTLPRPVLPGRSYLISRRCTQRLFLMRPDEPTNQAFIYCLGLAAERYKIQVLFTIAMSNHHHTGIWDPLGNYPQFLALFHKLFAKCQNSLRNRSENFWASEQTSVVTLQDPQDILDKLIYAVTNPVKDHLVEKAAHWPGVSSLTSSLENLPLSAERPAHFFKKNSSLPEKIDLPLSRPPGFRHLTQEEWAALLRQRVREVERKARSEREAVTRSANNQHPARQVLGVDRVLKQDWQGSPHTKKKSKQLSPRFAAKNKWQRIEALLRNKAFENSYRQAFLAFKRGVKNVLFPPGTYWLRLVAQVTCQEASCSV